MKKNVPKLIKLTVTLLFCFCAFVNNAYSQSQLTISGQMKSNDGTPLPGANVLISGTQIGTTSDFEGKYVLKNVPSDAVLDVSYIGFQTQSIQVNGRASINIVLIPDSNNLDEVVIIGYQSIKKKDLTGAVSVVDPIRTNKNISNTLAESLQGLAAGITVRNGGQPGQNAQIEIRGAASFVNSNPL